MLVTFASAEQIDVQLDIDLTRVVGSPERYYELTVEPPSAQAEDIKNMLPQLTDSLRLYMGDQLLRLQFESFTAARADKQAFLDGSITSLSAFRFIARLPTKSDPLKLVVSYGAPFDYPIAMTVQIPAAHVSITRWLLPGVYESEPLEWASLVRPSNTNLPSASLSPPLRSRFDPNSLPWWRQLIVYLELGFRHIVPEGTDHILFVLGLFFLGITWRKLLTQTTMFTIAHATTLFLSTYGLFSLPSRYVEPAIALSITWIAIENVLTSKLGAGRLAIVFGFGLVHGLGFASSLSDIPFPKRDFFFALLGFNFGVDFGQLFIIAMAFLVVGWFRDRPWFRARIAVPCSVLIALTGFAWAVQRIVYYGYS